jgi:hypothetical protein
MTKAQIRELKAILAAIAAKSSSYPIDERERVLLYRAQSLLDAAKPDGASHRILRKAV